MRKIVHLIAVLLVAIAINVVVELSRTKENVSAATLSVLTEHEIDQYYTVCIG